MSISQFKSWPVRRDAWLEVKCAAPQLKPQNRFNGDSIEPTRRARVPSPTAAACVWRRTVHSSADQLWLKFVMLRVLSRGGMVDRVDKIPKFHGAVAITLQGRCDGAPSGSVCILSAVRPDTRHVSFDVARLKVPFVERGI